MNDREYIHNFQVKKDNFYRLYQDFYPSLVLFARKMLNPEEGAEDLVQDVFVRTWETRKTLPVIENVSVYLYRAVKYRCLNELRNRKSHRKIENEVLAGDEAYLETLYVEQETLRRVNDVIVQLPPKCRMIFIRVIDGFSNQEIAAEMGIAEETVKKQKQIARKFIKERLGDLFLLFFLFHD